MEHEQSDEAKAPDEAEGTRIDMLKAACEDLFPKFVEAGTSRCARYVGEFLFDKLLPKTSARRKLRG